jgi:Ca2+-binding RTX toxin-like protein
VFGAAGSLSFENDFAYIQDLGTSPIGAIVETPGTLTIELLPGARGLLVDRVLSQLTFTSTATDLPAGSQTIQIQWTFTEGQTEPLSATGTTTVTLHTPGAAIDGTDGADALLGSVRAETIRADDGDDIVVGLDGDDRIDGGAGWLDLLVGGRGADVLTGGAGHDFFAFVAFDEDGDIITDFHAEIGDEHDILDLRPLWTRFTRTEGIASADDAVASGHLTFLQNGLDTQVFADADGNDHPGYEYPPTTCCWRRC